MAEQIEKIVVPDIGGAEDVDVIEISVAPGDSVNAEDPLITLEGDKASMEVPSPMTGVVDAISIKVGDKVSEGSLILTLKTSAAGDAAPAEKVATKEAQPAETVTEKPEMNATRIEEVRIPDIGDAADVDVIEVNIKAGDEINKEDPLITLEGDKASMDVPSPVAGKITEVKIAVGDKANEGDLVCLVEVQGAAASKPAAKKSAAQAATKAEAFDFASETKEPKGNGDVHAGPGARRLAHELDLDLSKIRGTGGKGRVTKEDVKNFVKGKMAQGGGVGFDLPAPRKIDFSKFGEIETLPLNKIRKASGANLHRNWVSIPHVTQFDEADITDMEAFRQEKKGEAIEKGFKLTPLVFIMKAVAAALQEYPEFNASLDSTGENLILKKYIHIGVAVDTPNGLVVPVVRDVDQKSLFDLAKELGEISKKARETGLSMADMQGGCFTISSLGGIGGTAFTPIINAPEVGILGVSKSQKKLMLQENGEFEPRLMLPLSLSYDHRVIDGAAAARFIVYLSAHLTDIRTHLL